MNTPIYSAFIEYCEAFFDESGKLLSFWHENDGHWTEGMDGLMTSLGFKVVHVDDDHPRYAEFKKTLCAALGDGTCDD